MGQGQEFPFLIPTDRGDFLYRYGLFAVSADFQFDSQILNPVPENSRSWAPNDSTNRLPHASLLCSAWLKDSERWILSGTDLSNMYRNFLVVLSHATRNHIHGVFKGSDFLGWHAYDESLKDRDVVG